MISAENRTFKVAHCNQALPHALRQKQRSSFGRYRERSGEDFPEECFGCSAAWLCLSREQLHRADCKPHPGALRAEPPGVLRSAPPGALHSELHGAECEGWGTYRQINTGAGFKMKNKTVHSRLYRSRSLQPNTHFSAFLKIYKI